MYETKGKTSREYKNRKQQGIREDELQQLGKANNNPMKKLQRKEKTSEMDELKGL